MRRLVAFILGLGLFAGCKPSVPSQYIQPDEMEDVLYDYYLGQGMSQTRHDGQTEYYRRLNYEAVLRKHGLTEAEFDSSLVYYYTRADRFVKIFEHVQKRLSDEALALGASISEVERFTSQSLSGDTAEIWEGRRQAVLLPKPPYHVLQFSQKADTAFHQGDSFLMTFNSTYLVQSGSRTSTAYLAVVYANDSVVTQNTTVSSAGSTKLRIAPCQEKVKEIKGYIYMAPRLSSDNNTEVCMLMLDHIQLVRFHHKNDTRQADTKADTLKQEMELKPEKTIRPDTLHQLRSISQ